MAWKNRKMHSSAPADTKIFSRAMLSVYRLLISSRNRGFPCDSVYKIISAIFMSHYVLPVYPRDCDRRPSSAREGLSSSARISFTVNVSQSLQHKRKRELNSYLANQRSNKNGCSLA